MVENNKINIYQKMLNIRESISYIKQDNFNQGQNFNYVSSSNVLQKVVQELNKQKIILEPEIIGKKITVYTNSKGTTQFLTELDIEFVFINVENPQERIVKKWYGQGCDNAEKGVGKALTYAEKYFLLKYFNIATDKDDPDSQNQKEYTLDNIYLKRIYATAREHNKNNDELHIFIKKAYKKESMKLLTAEEAENLITRLKNSTKSI